MTHTIPASKLPLSHHCSDRGACGFVLVAQPDVTLVSLLVLLAVIFAVTQAIELRRIRRERNRADRITDFLTNMYKVSAPSEARGNTVTAREILDRSSDEIERELDRDPEVRSQLMRVMARTYENLGLFSRAHALLERVVRDRVSPLLLYRRSWCAILFSLWLTTAIFRSCSSIIHFGFPIASVQPVINVRGDELFAGRELIRKWSSRETAYWVSEKLGAMILD